MRFVGAGAGGRARGMAVRNGEPAAMGLGRAKERESEGASE